MSRMLIELFASSAWLATVRRGDYRKASAADSPAFASVGPSILLVESHSLIGVAVGGLLAGPPLGATVETVLDTENAIARLDAAQFDVVICQISDPPSVATDFVVGLAAASSKVPVVFLADPEEEHLLLDNLTSGATGFFTMDCSPRELIQGLSSVMQGQYTVGSRLKRRARARLAGVKTGSAQGGRRRPAEGAGD